MGHAISFPLWVEVLCSIFCVVVVILIVRGIYKNYLTNIFSRTKRVEAELISKVYDKYVQIRSTLNTPGSGIKSPTSGLRAGNLKESYLLYFRTEEKVVELDVDKSIYDKFKEGEVGILEYKGNMFHFFEVKK